jgi:NodT family efflux transporter outer membrane factor (OMF) lipoprotein
MAQHDRAITLGRHALRRRVNDIMQHCRKLATALVLLSVAGCTVGPDYRRPAAIVAASYKEAAAKPPADGWKLGEPRDAIDRGAWWSVYRDPQLDELERQVEISNQNLKASEAAYRAAGALVAEARAGFFPTLGLGSSATRSGGGGSTGGSTGTTRGGSRGAQTIYDLTATASWAPDLWGRIRRTVESDVANAQASAADLALAKLSAQSALATDYLQLRIADELKRLLDSAATAFSRSLDITRNQYNSGVAARADVAQAQTQLDTTLAQAINVGVARAQFEHAIAVLIGKPPAELTIAPLPAALATAVPNIPTGLPSALLERRPDIAAAERQMAAANAQIGVAISAYYPDLSLSASYGYAATSVDLLLRASNSAWSVGAQLAETVFEGGLRGAEVDFARAAYDQNVATYRQTVLTAFQQVEDQLSTLRILQDQAVAEDKAVASARLAEQLVLNQYRAGTVPYTSVITAQTAALSNEETALTIMQNRLTASVALIQALGGGWDSSQLPDRARIEADRTQIDAR